MSAPTPSAATAPSLETQEKILRKQQHIEALIAQNEALHARVRELETPLAEPPPEPLPPPVAVVESVSTATLTTSATATPTVEKDLPLPPAPPELERPVATASPRTTQLSTEPAILPNADGLIDLVALLTPLREGDEVNPFAVRTLPPDAVREITLHVRGVIHGASPCALINHRAVLPGESTESLNLTAVESDAVLIRHAGRLLRLPVSEKPVRIRLPL